MVYDTLSVYKIGPVGRAPLGTVQNAPLTYSPFTNYLSGKFTSLLTLSEVEKAIIRSKRRKAAGPDKLTLDIFKKDGSPSVGRLTDILFKV